MHFTATPHIPQTASPFQSDSINGTFQVELGDFTTDLQSPPTHPLNPINPDNARILRITAAAGTELADAYSYGTLIRARVPLIAPIQKKFKIHRTVFLHAAWLDQISIHCPIFLTAASRRSLDRVSVPVWGTFLSEPLDIVAMGSRYLSI